MRHGSQTKHDAFAQGAGQDGPAFVSACPAGEFLEVLQEGFTQHQLFALRVLRQFFRTDFRGIVALVEDMADLQRMLGLTKVPHFTTLQKAHERILKKGPSSDCCPSFSGLPSVAA